MIYITGDIHGDITRFKDKKIKKLKKADTLLICGDFGFSLDNSKKNLKLLKWIGKRRFNIAFVDGANDNYSMVKQQEYTDWNGSPAYNISGKLFCLKRGEIYTIDNKTIMAFGGGDFVAGDEGCQDTVETNLPTFDEMKVAIENLSNFNMNVDIIISYEAPEKIKLFIDMENNETNFINTFLQNMAQNTKFNKWYFGKYHLNKIIPPHYQMLFTDVVKYQ